MKRRPPKINCGTHLPVLINVVLKTTGSILELGCGTFSTPFLHWFCFGKDRKLVTYEDNTRWESFLMEYSNSYHATYMVKDWNDVALIGPWDVAFVDHSPHGRRVEEIKKLVDNTNYVILHDSQGVNDRIFHYNTIYPLFKYRYDFKKVRPYTTVLSNFKELSDL
jgi:hypothetical protein